MPTSAVPADPPPVPDWMRGLWRRRSIAWPDGRVDATTTVYWLQTATAFADIRIPADRPACDGRTRLEDLDVAMRAALAAQGGFAGWTALRGAQCRWHREVDFQPPSGVPDAGTLRRAGALLIEDGAHEPYVEIWEPVDCGPAALAPPDAWLARLPRGARLLTCGDAFLYVCDRRPALPRAASLSALAARRGLPAVPAAWLDCEISLGRIAGGRRPWQIALSTLPWREGRPLFTAGGEATC